MEATKAEDSIVMEIDNEPAKHVYEKYLGRWRSSKYNQAQTPSISVEFPFLIQREGIPIARAAFRVLDDGSILFGGNIHNGDKLQFSINSIEATIQSGFEFKRKLQSKPIETMFVYSCMARRRFLGANITHDIMPLKELAPVCGFYSYGEFYTDTSSVEFLNHTMTVLALSEEDEIPYGLKSSQDACESYEMCETMDTLISLVNNLSKEHVHNELITLYDECTYDTKRCELKHQNKLIVLAKKEKQLFELLLNNKRNIISFETIDNILWPEKYVSSTTRRTLIHRLREKVGGEIIKTYKNLGCSLDI